jgi:plastocyanin
MKKYFILILIASVFNLKIRALIHVVYVWDGYMQFLPADLGTIFLGDTVNWLPLAGSPSMPHTITSTNIPLNAIPFDQIWQAPSDTFFQYIPVAVGLYEYECTPHIAMGMIGRFNVEESLNKDISNQFNVSNLFFPNPTNNKLFFESEMNGNIFAIYTLNGSLIMKGIIQNNIDVSILRKGLYNLIIIADRPRSQQFIVY